MPTFEVTVVERWEYKTTVDVEAETKEEAVELAFALVEKENRELTNEEYFLALEFLEYQAWDVEEMESGNLANEEEGG